VYRRVGNWLMSSCVREDIKGDLIPGVFDVEGKSTQGEAVMLFCASLKLSGTIEPSSGHNQGIAIEDVT
jgi:hypothetical protein